ncbi:MAG: hypothetical protein ACRYG4_04330 [Janthinobacterium lividum]
MALNAAPPPRSYADRVDALADAINLIGERRSDPNHFHECRDAAARTARSLARALRVDRL